MNRHSRPDHTGLVVAAAMVLLAVVGVLAVFHESLAAVLLR